MLLQVISILWLLFIGSYSIILWKRLWVPYVVLLFIAWLLFVVFKEYLPFWAYISGLNLSWDLLFYVLLPILLFESAFNISSKKLVHDTVPILLLAVWSFVISNLFIWFWLYYVLQVVGLEVPLYMTFLFWAIISATDPVAVLSLFKEFWAPKRLTYLFEWESIMNDWVWVAFFLIVMDIIRKWVFEMWDLWIWILVFIWMMIFWIIWWIFVWWIFSKMIQNVHNMNAELTLSLILAHTAFISAEVISHYFIHLSETTWIEIIKCLQISPIIATAIAWLTLWNYWRYKLSSNVRSFTWYFFDYFTFLSNSLIFILMWILIWNYIGLIAIIWFPIILTILLVMLWRIISVYWVIYPYNFFTKSYNRISSKWAWLLSWWSLRWWIAITMILMTPKDLVIPWWWLKIITPHEFLTAVTISCVVFTLTVKALSIWSMIKRMWVVNLSKDEQFTMDQVKRILDEKIIKMLTEMRNKWYWSKESIESLLMQYDNDSKSEIEKIKRIRFWSLQMKKLLQKFSLWIEKQVIIKSFENSEIDELSLKIILYKIDKQLHRLDLWLSQISTWDDISLFGRVNNAFFDFIYFWNNLEWKIKHKYLYYRARSIASAKTAEELMNLKERFCLCDENLFIEIIDQYKNWQEDANRKMNNIFISNKKILSKVEEEMTNKQIVGREINILVTYLDEWILTRKTYNNLYHDFTREDVPE